MLVINNESSVNGLSLTKLELDDGSNTVAARGHRSKIALIAGKRRQAYLEIFPNFEHLVDIILVTFVLTEKLRKQKRQGGG